MEKLIIYKSDDGDFTVCAVTPPITRCTAVSRMTKDEALGTVAAWVYDAEHPFTNCRREIDLEMQEDIHNDLREIIKRS